MFIFGFVPIWIMFSPLLQFLMLIIRGYLFSWLAGFSLFCFVLLFPCFCFFVHHYIPLLQSCTYMHHWLLWIFPQLSCGFVCQMYFGVNISLSFLFNGLRLSFFCCFPWARATTMATNTLIGRRSQVTVGWPPHGVNKAAQVFTNEPTNQT